MSHTVKACTVAWIALIAAGTSAASSEELDRWVPGFAVTGGVTILDVAASVESASRPGTPPLPYSTSTRCVSPCISGYKGGSAASSDLMVTPYVGASIEVMTPGLKWGGNAVRLFMHGDVLPGFPFDRSIAKVGAPGPFDYPKNDPPPLGDGRPWLTYTEDQVLGRGGVMRAELDSVVFGAGMGVVFGFKSGGRRWSIKPSIEWTHFEVSFSGQFDEVRLEYETLDPNLPGNVQNCRPYNLTNCRTQVLDSVRMSEGVKRSYNGIGPGIEFELEAARSGDFLFSIFVGGSAHRILEKRKVQLSASQPSSVEPQDDPYTATWSATLDPWFYRAGVGLRVRWLPE